MVTSNCVACCSGRQWLAWEGCRESRLGVVVWSGRRQAERQAGTRVAEAECGRRSEKRACPGSSRMIRIGGGMYVCVCR